MSAKPTRLRLLPPEALIPTSDVDHADWNYRRMLGWLQRKRFTLLLSMMGDRRFKRLLELGYGSGVLMPELATRCDELYGADPHSMPRAVREVLLRHGVRARLVTAGAAELPFDDGFFDCAVTVSALEYAEEIQEACEELRRVLEPGGELIVVTPGHSPLLDLALKLTTRESAQNNYGARRQQLIPTLRRYFRVGDERIFPGLVGRLLPVYHVLRLVNVQPASAR